MKVFKDKFFKLSIFIKCKKKINFFTFKTMISFKCVKLLLCNLLNVFFDILFTL